MSNSKSFDFSFLNKVTVDSLIAKCRRYVKQNLSKSDVSCFDKAYKASRFDKVKYILKKTLERIENKNKISESKKDLNSEISGASELFVSSDTNEGRWDDNMNTNGEMGGVNIIIVIILVIATIGTVLYMKFKGKKVNVKNQTVNEVLSNGLKNGNNIKYTDKDRDLIELIHELSVIYDHTDEYLNS